MREQKESPNYPRGKSGLTQEDSFNPDSKEYKLSTTVSSQVSDYVSSCIGDVLDYMDASLPQNVQTETLKRLVKQRMYALTRQVQHQVYYAFGIEPYQLGDTLYIKEVLDGNDEHVIAYISAEGGEPSISIGDVPKDVQEQ